MEIVLQNIGRRFNRDWIFKGVDYHFTQGNSYAILGPNGSGKSTLMQIVVSNLTPSEGEISYLTNHKHVEVGDFFPSISLVAPYQELIEEFTLRELIDFHFSFKQIENGLTTQGMIELLGLAHSANKEIRYFSSGMKQRTKLALACCAQTTTLFLDEPTSNLDAKGILWYNDLIRQYGKNKLLIVCSNQQHEYKFCQHHLYIERYKGQ